MAANTQGNDRDPGSRDEMGDVTLVLPVMVGDAAIGTVECRGDDPADFDADLLERLQRVGRDLLQRLAATDAHVKNVELEIEGNRAPWLCSLAPLARAEGTEIAPSLLGVERQDELLAMLGHELRNPLAAIRNATELLGMVDRDDPDLRRIHAVLDRQTRQSAKLIDGLLEVARIARGKLDLDYKPVDLTRLLGEVALDHASQLERRDLSLELELPDEPLWVEGDPVRLAQVFDSLLSNAAKFTPQRGHIVIVARREARARVVVRDDGIGIEPDLLPHVFDPFRQGRQSIDRSTGGLGLGLTLARGLVALHRGTIAVRSDGPGRGSAFTVELDLAGEPGPARSLPPPSGVALRVLVIEDNHDLALMLARLLGAAGHEVVVAPSGRHGLERARSFAPQAVVCDIGLPGDLDGLDVARALRADPDLASVGLIALTGYGGSEYRARAREAGFDRCLVKPVTLETLEKHLHRVARSS